jgi:iron complex transport system ATP-binding protein
VTQRLHTRPNPADRREAHGLHADAVTLGYGERIVVDELDLAVAPGAITAIVGANGCGKSTVLRALARLLRPTAGAVRLDGVPLVDRPPREVARTIGLLPQQPIAPEGIAVADLVGRGRHPHHGPLSRWNRRDHEAVAAALAATDTIDLADRPVDELSGGQRQRVWIAMALAQETDILLLDEPTSFLDLNHQLEVLDLLTDLNRDRGTTIVMVLHDVNLAARYAHLLVALREGKVHASGRPHDVLSPELVQEVFGIGSRVITDPVSETPLVIPCGRHHSDGRDTISVCRTVHASAGAPGAAVR